MSEKIGIYICHCGSNIAGTVDVEEVARWAGKNIPDVAISRDYKFMCSSLGQSLIEEDIEKEGLTRDRRGRLLAAPAREDLPPGLRERGAQSVSAADDQRPRALFLGPYRQEGGHREDQGPRGRGRRTGAAPTAAGTDVREGQPGHARDRRRHRRLASHAGTGRRRLPGLPGRTRTVDRRAHGPVRQDLPHAGLLGLHSHPRRCPKSANTTRSRCTPTPSWKR